MHMPRSSNDIRGSRPDRQPSVLPSFTRYDLLLAVLPIVFLVSLLVGVVFSISIEFTLMAGSLLGVIALIDALFVHPPNRTDRY
jgi:hypothetical protein